MIAFTRIFYVCFALVAIAGGLMGYVNKKSVASLVAGSISGLLLLIAAYVIHSKLNGGLTVGLVVSVMLAGRFIPNYFEKRTPVPAGLMSVLSVAGIVITILCWHRQ